MQKSTVITVILNRETNVGVFLFPSKVSFWHYCYNTSLNEYKYAYVLNKQLMLLPTQRKPGRIGHHPYSSLQNNHRKRKHHPMLKDNGSLNKLKRPDN